MNGSKLIALTLPLKKCIGPLNSLLMTWLWRLLSIGFLGRIHLYFEPEIFGSLERYIKCTYFCPCFLSKTSGNTTNIMTSSSSSQMPR